MVMVCFYSTRFMSHVPESPDTLVQTVMCHVTCQPRTTGTEVHRLKSARQANLHPGTPPVARVHTRTGKPQPCALLSG